VAEPMQLLLLVSNQKMGLLAAEIAVVLGMQHQIVIPGTAHSTHTISVYSCKHLQGAHGLTRCASLLCTSATLRTPSQHTTHRSLSYSATPAAPRPQAVPATGGIAAVPALLLVLPLLETELPLMLGCAAQVVRAGGKAKGGGAESAVVAAGVDRQGRPFQNGSAQLAACCAAAAAHATVQDREPCRPCCCCWWWLCSVARCCSWLWGSKAVILGAADVPEVGCCWLGSIGHAACRLGTAGASLLTQLLMLHMAVLLLELGDMLLGWLVVTW
jgi:hypothetical protein